MQPEIAVGVMGIRPRKREVEEVHNDAGPDLLLNKDGAPRPVLENIIRAMSGDGWRGAIGFDELAVRPVLLRATPAHDARGLTGRFPRAWADVDDAITAAWLQATLSLFVNPGQIPDAVRTISAGNKFHPARDYLAGLKWDKKPRLDLWLHDFLGVEDSKLSRAFASKFLIGAVSRARKPGAKADNTLILEGPQGSLKSSALEALMPAPELFTDDLGDALGKEAAERIQGKWLVEIAELDAMSRAETTRIKSFITRQVDHFRPAYGRHPADFPRQCVFAGTTNQEIYLRDETGGRRFWPVVVGVIKLTALRAARDHLWAEAVARYEAGESWWLSDADTVEAAASEQRARFDEDVWHERIREILIGRTEVTIADVLDALKIEPARQGESEKKRAAKTLRALGWEKGQVRKPDGSRPRVYRPSPLPSLASPVSPVTTPDPNIRGCSGSGDRRSVGKAQVTRDA